ncbi:MAG: IS30 family transposase [Candidatus Gracilibacteria bacterium]|nr:IS30 family transposase [Candidatus Gracilibacteria bacterium]
MSHKQFTEKDIYAIEIYLKEGYNYSKIALKLNKHHTSIGRIVKKYKSPKTGIFYAKHCIKLKKKIRCIVNRANKNRIKDLNLEEFILKYIKKYWSPEQIAGRYKEETNKSLSKDTIYKFIYQNYPELIKKYFRRKGKKYQHKRRERYQLNDRKMIEFRPKKVETRERLGDWEGDTVIGSRGGSKEVILTNVDRKSGYLLARKIKDKSGNSVLEGTLEVFKRIPKQKKLTITYDNGREFSEHSMIKYLTNLDVYFANPYCSWERGTNENTNGLIRQFAPKKIDFEKLTQNQLKYYVSLINFRPRKRLNYKTPHEVFFGKDFKLCSSL